MRMSSSNQSNQVNNQTKFIFRSANWRLWRRFGHLFGDSFRHRHCDATSFVLQRLSSMLRSLRYVCVCGTQFHHYSSTNKMWVPPLQRKLLNFLELVACFTSRIEQMWRVSGFGGVVLPHACRILGAPPKCHQIVSASLDKILSVSRSGRSGSTCDRFSRCLSYPFRNRSKRSDYVGSPPKALRFSHAAHAHAGLICVL